MEDENATNRADQGQWNSTKRAFEYGKSVDRATGIETSSEVRFASRERTISHKLTLGKSAYVVRETKSKSQDEGDSREDVVLKGVEDGFVYELTQSSQGLVRDQTQVKVGSPTPFSPITVIYNKDGHVEFTEVEVSTANYSLRFADELEPDPGENEYRAHPLRTNMKDLVHRVNMNGLYVLLPDTYSGHTTKRAEEKLVGEMQDRQRFASLSVRMLGIPKLKESIMSSLLEHEDSMKPSELPRIQQLLYLQAFAQFPLSLRSPQLLEDMNLYKDVLNDTVSHLLKYFDNRTHQIDAEESGNFLVQFSRLDKGDSFRLKVFQEGQSHASSVINPDGNEVVYDGYTYYIDRVEEEIALNIRRSADMNSGMRLTLPKIDIAFLKGELKNPDPRNLRALADHVVPAFIYTK